MTDLEIKEINDKFVELGLPKIIEDSGKTLTEFGIRLLFGIGLHYALQVFESVMKTLQR